MVCCSGPDPPHLGIGVCARAAALRVVGKSERGTEGPLTYISEYFARLADRSPGAMLRHISTTS